MHSNNQHTDWHQHVYKVKLHRKWRGENAFVEEFKPPLGGICDSVMTVTVNYWLSLQHYPCCTCRILILNMHKHEQAATNNSSSCFTHLHIHTGSHWNNEPITVRHLQPPATASSTTGMQWTTVMTATSRDLVYNKCIHHKFKSYDLPHFNKIWANSPKNSNSFTAEQ